MAKVTKKEETSDNLLPTVTDEIFKLKVDRESQKFYIEEKEDYGLFDEITIRPLDLFTKLKAYNDEFEVVSESTLYHELKEARDSKGKTAQDKDGIVCGRVVWQRLIKDLSDDEKEENKSKAKYYCFIFGIGTVKGKEPVLIDFQVGGKNFMEVVNLLKKIKDEKKEYNKAEIRVIAHQNENKDFDWPEIEFMADFSRDLPVSGLEPFFDTVESYVQYHNERIDKKAKEYADKKAGKTSGFKKSNSFKRK